MKKKAVLACLMTLAMAVSPVGCLSASAEEGGASPASEVSTVSNNLSLTDPVNAGFSTDGLYSITCDWSGSSNYTKGTLNWHTKIFKDGQLYKEHVGKGWDGWTVPASARQITFPFFQELEDSGTYYYEVRIESNTPYGFYSSEWVTSEEMTYTRPDKALGTTVGYWDAEKTGLLHYESVEGASGYQWRLYKWNESSSQWAEIKIYYNASGYALDDTSLFTYVKPDSSRDEGGQDKTMDFSYDLSRYGEGKYCVTIKALSNNLDEIANGSQGAMSKELEIVGSSESSDDSGDAGSASLLEEQIEVAESGGVIKTQDVTCLSNAEMKMLLARGDVALEMEYTYEGVDYKIYIPAGAAVDNDIPWYGPLYLAMYYRNTGANGAGVTGPSYTVQKGDTLSKIAHANNMTLSELKAKNPQIVNVDKIMPGQIIQVK